MTGSLHCSVFGSPLYPPSVDIMHLWSLPFCSNVGLCVGVLHSFHLLLPFRCMTFQWSVRMGGGHQRWRMLCTTQWRTGKGSWRGAVSLAMMHTHTYPPILFIECHLDAEGPDSVGFLNGGFMICVITNCCSMNCLVKGSLEYSCKPEKQGHEGELWALKALSLTTSVSTLCMC